MNIAKDAEPKGLAQIRMFIAQEVKLSVKDFSRKCD